MHKLRALLGPLRVFDAVHRAGGVSRAAGVLHVTPGAVSQQLKHLEGALGVSLFQKDGREIELTKIGRQLALRVADAFDRIDNALTDVAESSQGMRLRLKVSPSLAIRWLVPRLAGFYALHDDIDIEIATIARAEDQGLEQADFAIRHGIGEWTDVQFDHLFDDEFIPVCAPRVAVGIASARDLLKANLLHSMMRTEGWELWFASAGLGHETLPRGLALANAALCYQAAADGLGVAVAQRA